MFSYIIQVICFKALFLAVYYVLLRKETFFVYNRIYLLVTPVLSFIIPFVKITSLQTMVPQEVMITMLPEVIIGASTATENIAQAPEITIPWMTMYLTGCMVSLLVLVLKIRKFATFLAYKEKGNHIIEVPESTEAFTFFNYIFIGKEIDPLSRKQILTHEKIHVTQRHTWDLIFFELLRVVLWFNPLVYVFQKQISIVHEYLADQKATAAISKKAYYEELLNTAFGTSNLSFTNTFFNKSLIKNRIIMLQKSKSKRSALIKYTFIAPLLLGMLVYVSCSEDNAATPVDSAESKTEVMERIDDLADAIMKKGNLNDEEIRALEFLAMPAKEGDKIYLSVDQYLKETAGDKDKKYQAVGEFSEEEKHIEYEDARGIPFAQIGKVPMFPGCETKGSEEERRDCFSSKITNHVNRNFDITVGSKANLTGKNRIFATFIIGKDGRVANVRARAEHGLLEDEAKRVISSLPNMEAGEKDGEAVAVYYTLPITFKIAE